MLCMNVMNIQRDMHWQDDKLAMWRCLCQRNLNHWWCLLYSSWTLWTPDSQVSFNMNSERRWERSCISLIFVRPAVLPVPDGNRSSTYQLIIIMIKLTTAARITIAGKRRLRLSHDDESTCILFVSSSLIVIFIFRIYTIPVTTTSKALTLSSRTSLSNPLPVSVSGLFKFKKLQEKPVSSKIRRR